MQKVYQMDVFKVENQRSHVMCVTSQACLARKLGQNCHIFYSFLSFTP